ncbi:hypothetical protein [Candidatus Odyssella thessalonicensis]|uniref:hypothetical protein n=1 Tax=Candidatus Odyssella thessalonicensis TaxID=84647 RepID=UPI000225B222|nr:hypothetical protein [Candidatus Odyssella thessalonicensis]
MKKWVNKAVPMALVIGYSWAFPTAETTYSPIVEGIGSHQMKEEPRDPLERSLAHLNTADQDALKELLLDESLDLSASYNASRIDIEELSLHHPKKKSLDVFNMENLKYTPNCDAPKVEREFQLRQQEYRAKMQHAPVEQKPQSGWAKVTNLVTAALKTVYRGLSTLVKSFWG